MTRRTRAGLLIALALAGLVGTHGRGAPAPLAGTLRDMVPADALIVIEANGSGAIVDRLLEPAVLDEVASLPGVKERLATPEFAQFRLIVSYIEAQLGVDWKQGAGTLLGGGIIAAALPNNGLVVVVESKDEALLRKLNDILIAGSRDDARKNGRPDPVTERTVEGVPSWSVGADEIHAIVGSRLIVASREGILKSVLKPPAGAVSLAAKPGYAEAVAAAGQASAATLYVDLKTLQGVPQIAAALEPPANPLGALLAGGLMDGVKRSNWLALGLQLEGGKFALEAVADGAVAATPSSLAFAMPGSGAGALPNFDVPRQIAGMSVYRDLNAFYRAKDQLFPERTSGLIFFENMMGIFFSGRDLTEEVFAEMKPEIRLVVANQEYDPTVGTPQVKVPAFALVAQSRHPEAFSAVMEEAWQKAVGLINVTRGQHAEPGLIIDRPTHRDVRYSVATNSPGKAEDRSRLPLRFNYRPTLVSVGETLILSSTEGLARDLIDATRSPGSGAADAVAGVHTLLELDGAQMASVLEADRDYLVQQNMVEKGSSQAEAEATIDIIIEASRRLGSLSLAGGVKGGRHSLRLEVQPKAR